MNIKSRPTKKQRETLSFIDNFISGHGYGPSYREIMKGLGYKSVASASLHIDNLITKGFLKKTDNSARSLEVVGSDTDFITGSVKPTDEKWLVQKVTHKFETAETSHNLSQAHIDELYVLVGALQVLGFSSAANFFKPRLTKLKKKIK